MGPAGWKVVSAANPNSFGAIAVDADVMKVEREHPNYWHIALTCTEFLVHPDFRASMARIDPKTGERAVIRFRGLWMVGDEDSPLTPFGSLPMQRSVFTDNCRRKLLVSFMSYQSLHAYWTQPVAIYWTARHISLWGRSPCSLYEGSHKVCRHRSYHEVFVDTVARAEKKEDASGSARSSE